MMEHAEIRRKLSAYLDNAVSGEEKEEVKRHLGRCGNCRAALADLEMTIGRLRSLPQVEPPPWLAGKIMAKVREAAAPKRGLWQRLFFPLHVKLPLAALALLFICVAGYYLARTVSPELPLTAPPPVAREEAPAPATAPPQPSAPQTSLPEAPAPLPPAAPGSPAAVPQQKMEAPATAPLPSPAQAPTPAMPAKPMPPPELQSADEEIGVGREALRPLGREEKGVSRGMMQQKKAAEDEALPAGKAEVTLRVSDPATAAETIEQAVTRHGGRISGQAYSGESHLLFIRIEAQRLPGLLDRLGRIGTVLERPPLSAGADGTVELAIRW
ncbi:MAG: DUF2275 domain-containing protein [Geobacteraceae bacterium]|nr:DUF2275 domain-containing protein [Geobacteraceae bacterium]